MQLQRIYRPAMFVSFDRSMLLTLLVVVSTTSPLVGAQAPGDAHSACSMPPVPDNVVRLLDSRWYRALLPSNFYDSAEWTQTPEGSVSRQHALANELFRYRPLQINLYSFWSGLPFPQDAGGRLIRTISLYDTMHTPCIELFLLFCIELFFSALFAH